MLCSHGQSWKNSYERVAVAKLPSVSFEVDKLAWTASCNMALITGSFPERSVPVGYPGFTRIKMSWSVQAMKDGHSEWRAFFNKKSLLIAQRILLSMLADNGWLERLSKVCRDQELHTLHQRYLLQDFEETFLAHWKPDKAEGYLADCPYACPSVFLLVVWNAPERQRCLHTAIFW